MGNIARILVAQHGATFIVDAEVPYDYELLFEHADLYARRRGSIELELNGVRWKVRTTTRRSPPCTACGERGASLSYADHQRIYCPRCARAVCLVPQLHSQRAPARKLPRAKNGQAGAAQRVTARSTRNGKS